MLLLCVAARVNSIFLSGGFMGSTDSMKIEVKHLRKDASRMISDLDRLRRELGSVSNEVTEELGERVANTIQHELGRLKGRISSLNRQLSQYAHTLEVEIKQRPYMYIAAAVGVGALALSVLARKSRRTLH
jgi:ElaB/YqjD/DUF883 family membrane-anchored ribosome-binding protein